jgi:hypothetical protein
VIVLLLTKGDVAPQLEVNFAGNPAEMEKMMLEGLNIIRELAINAKKAINIAEIDDDPWQYM